MICIQLIQWLRSWVWTFVLPKNDKILCFAVCGRRAVFPAATMATTDRHAAFLGTAVETSGGSSSSTAGVTAPGVQTTPRTAAVDDVVVEVPQKLIVALTECIPVCIYWADPKKRCKKGNKCPFRHALDGTIDSHAPFMSWDVHKDGVVRGTLRPPISKALDMFLEDNGVNGGRRFRWLGGVH